MLNLSLRPGQGLGPFMLGQCLPEVLVWLQQRKLEYRCVEVKFDSKDTLDRDILACFPEHGFQLHFEPRSQRLRLVEVFDTTRLQMVYMRNVVFGGASNAPTFGRIYRAFGPTYPGEPDAEGTGSYPLQYPGIMLLFPQLPTHSLVQPGVAYGGEGAVRDAPSFPVPLGVAAERIYIHAGTRGPISAVLASPPPPMEPGTLYAEPLEGVPCQGLYLGPGCSTAVRFGDSPQDVVSLLGQPARVAQKAGGTGGLSAAACDYFYTYPSRGLDLLFCGMRHRLVKVVLHTNVPGHPDFNAYCKANFRVHPCGWRPPQPRQQQQQQEAPSEEDLPMQEVAGMQSEGGYSAAEEASTAEDVFAAAGAGLEELAAPRGGHEVTGAVLGQAGWQPSSTAEGGQPTTEGHSMAGKAGLSLPGEQAGGAQHVQQQGPGQDDSQQPPSEGGFGAAYRRLVGLVGDVITLDPQRISPEPGSANAAAAAQEGFETALGSTKQQANWGQESGGQEGAVQGEQGAGSVDAKPLAGSGGSGEASAAATAGGKPPKHPAPAAAPVAVPGPSKSSKKKKGKKKKGQAAAGGGGNVGQPEFEESDSMADVSASDSGMSSLASSPSMASPIVGSLRRRVGLVGGYRSSDWGSTADLAAKEGSVGVGSHLDGWSDAEDLFPMAHGQLGSEGASAGAASSAGAAAAAGGAAAANGLEGPAVKAGALGSTGSLSELAPTLGWQAGDASLAAWTAAPAAAPPSAGATSALTAALEAQQAATAGSGGLAMAAAGRNSRGTLSEALVQTCEAAVGTDEAGTIDGLLSQGVEPSMADLDDGWEESDSPHGFVIPGKPRLFDEGAAEYESVPRQRDCSTQTPPAHLLPAARGAGSGCPVSGGRAHSAAAPCDMHAVVTSDSRLEDIEAVFGRQGGPALHTLPGATQFGPSYLCAYRGVVFEVLQNGLIATVTLFKA